MLALSIEVVIKLKSRTHIHYNLRKKFYHVVCIGHAIAIVLLGEIHKDFNQSSLGTCSLINRSFTESARLIGWIIENIIMLGLIFYMLKKVGKTYSNVIFNYFLMILLMTASVSSTNILQNLSYFGIDSCSDCSELAFAIGCSTGISMGLSRLANKRLLKQIMWKITCKKVVIVKKNPEVINDEDSFLSDNIYNLGSFFKSITIKSLMQMLAIVSVHFNDKDSKHFTVEYEYEYNQYEYDEILFIYHSEAHGSYKIKESKGHIVYNPDLYLIEYKPDVFQRIRDVSNIDRNSLI